MNDTAIKNFAVWARRQLMDDVRLQMKRWAIDEEATVPANADVLNGAVVSIDERRQRSELLRACREEGADALVERAAYTWFNRFIAIRFMELHDYLPCGLRFFSATDGSFEPQVLKEALRADIEGIDRARVAELVSAADDEALFRYLFISQCNELAACMPAVFERIGSAMELLLPAGLLREGSAIDRMVTDIPEDDWREGVEIVGWMYQYYVSERKREVFDGYQAGKKAERQDIAPATQTFTPEWLVRFMTDNSLGRLWMMNHPESHLSESMDYFIAPEGEIEKFAVRRTPEDITLCDPCCGSGHILAYAFDLLASMYEELGYGRRDIPRNIIEKNLFGMEVDHRAAALASFVLTMKAMEYDSRFLRRGVVPHVVTLLPVTFEEGERSELPAELNDDSLLNVLSHLDECGSLFDARLANCAIGSHSLETSEDCLDLFSVGTSEKVDVACRMCETLSTTYDIVITNPPYMGSSNMNKWLSEWVKDHYPDTRRDLCTCFIERCSSMLNHGGYAALATTNSWMFLSSFEKLRSELITQRAITALVQMSVHGFKGIAAQVCAFVFCEQHAAGVLGGYVRLDDFDHHSLQEPKTLEAIANPDCGWFYRRCAADFKGIPGSPIAYWASSALRKAFRECTPLSEIAVPRQGLATSDNGRFLRRWWEVSKSRCSRDCSNREDALRSKKRWFPVIRGGSFRKWSGEYDEVVNWENDGEEMKEAVLEKYTYLKTPDFVIKNQNDYFKQAVTWSKISSGIASFRYAPKGMLFEVAGACLFGSESELKLIQGACNSSAIASALEILSPTMNFEVGQIGQLPISKNANYAQVVEDFVDESRAISKSDYDSFETSWDFKRHPMV